MPLLSVRIIYDESVCIRMSHTVPSTTPTLKCVYIYTYIPALISSLTLTCVSLSAFQIKGTSHGHSTEILLKTVENKEEKQQKITLLRLSLEPPPSYLLTPYVLCLCPSVDLMVICMHCIYLLTLPSTNPLLLPKLESIYTFVLSQLKMSTAWLL